MRERERERERGREWGVVNSIVLMLHAISRHALRLLVHEKILKWMFNIYRERERESMGVVNSIVLMLNAIFHHAQPFICLSMRRFLNGCLTYRERER